VHVVDNAGNWNDERNSNTNYQPVSFEPVEVDISGIAADKELSQAPLEDWNVTFGGPYTDLATSIQLTSDGGYIIAGNTVSKDAKGAAGKDNWQIAWLIKTDSCGNELWNRSFYGEKTIFDDWYLDGDISDHYFVANSAQQTSDGGYILAGYTQPYHVGYFNDWMIKTDSVGNEIWSKYFGGGYRGGIKRFMPTLDDGYILIGTLYPGFASGNDVAFLIKTNSTGDEIWYKRFGVGYGHNYGSSVQTTNDGGYILAGNRIYDGIAWLIKTDSEGNELWNKTFGKARGDEVSSVKLMVDGGFVLAGSTISYSSGGRDAWLIKTDSEGNELWNKTFGGAHDEVAVSAQPTPDGGTVLAGDTYSFGSGRSDAWLIKTDSEGNELWNRTFGGADSDGANSVQLTFDGGYILAGETRSFGAGGYDAWLIKLAPI
jgi:predicted secreted protein